MINCCFNSRLIKCSSSIIDLNHLSIKKVNKQQCQLLCMSYGVLGIAYIIFAIILAFFTRCKRSTMQTQIASLHVARYLFFSGILVLILFFSKDRWQWPTKLLYDYSFCRNFSFSIVLLVLKKWLFLGPITPIGGVGLILSCGYWAYLLIKKSR